MKIFAVNASDCWPQGFFFLEKSDQSFGSRTQTTGPIPGDDDVALEPRMQRQPHES